MQIEVSMESQATVRVALTGSMHGIGLGELRREIDRARRFRRQIQLDLGEVTLLDRYSVAFLVEQTREGVRLVNCPAYIEPWIEKEMAARAAASVAV